jgi:two-component system sensor histidine kinase TctE
MGMSRQSDLMVRQNASGDVFYAVYDEHGKLLGGDGDLPMVALTPPNRPSATRVRFREREVFAMGAKFASGTGSHFTVIVAETGNRRDALYATVLSSMLVPFVGLMALALLAIWFGVHRALRPLLALERAVAQHDLDHLAPFEGEDIPTEVGSLVRALNGLVTRLKDASDRQRQFVANAAHQLRTPLAGIQARTELLSRTAGEANSEHLISLLSLVKRTTRMAQQLLALARSEPGALRGHVRNPVDLKALIEAAADDWFRRAIDRGIDFGFDLSPAQISGHAAMISELLENIVDNALVYTPRGGSVTVSCKSVDGYATVRVDDSGPGIPVEERPRVVERFYRGVHRVETEGAGLGLAIVNEIAADHGAVVEVGESLVAGARIEVRFPVA